MAMKTPGTPASTNFARMVILSVRKFRQRQDAARSLSHRAIEPKTRSLSGGTWPSQRGR